MAWKELSGYRYPYRISEEGEVQCKRTGEWLPVHVIAKKTNHSYIPAVSLAVLPKGHKNYTVTSLMEGVWLPVREKGQVYIHKNGSLMDCSVYNIRLGTRAETGKKAGGSNRRVIAKVDRSGKVLDMYRSASDAARKNHMSLRSVVNRCKGRVQTAMEMDGFSFRYEG